MTAGHIGLVCVAIVSLAAAVAVKADDYSSRPITTSRTYDVGKSGNAPDYSTLEGRRAARQERDNESQARELEKTKAELKEAKEELEKARREKD